jgi:hypothetical protein
LDRYCYGLEIIPESAKVYMLTNFALQVFGTNVGRRFGVVMRLLVDLVGRAQSPQPTTIIKETPYDQATATHFAVVDNQRRCSIDAGIDKTRPSLD